MLIGWVPNNSYQAQENTNERNIKQGEGEYDAFLDDNPNNDNGPSMTHLNEPTIKVLIVLFADTFFFFNNSE